MEMDGLTNNPKMMNSGIVDCIPQTGTCPIGCPGCFYNKGFYLDIHKDLPLIPDPDEINKHPFVVRMNSGNDSTVEKDLVVATAKKYKHAFFNTSEPDLNFPGPVVVTVNPGKMTDNDFWTIKRFNMDLVNLMFVRVRVNWWNLELVQRVIKEYTTQQVPVVLTFMRYNNLDDILLYCREFYEVKAHLINKYYCPKRAYEFDLVNTLRKVHPLVYHCGNPHSSLCVTCGNCLREYWATYIRMLGRRHALGIDIKMSSREFAEQYQNKPYKGAGTQKTVVIIGGLVRSHSDGDLHYMSPLDVLRKLKNYNRDIDLNMSNIIAAHDSNDVQALAGLNLDACEVYRAHDFCSEHGRPPSMLLRYGGDCNGS